jgi:hypothetical protein
MTFLWRALAVTPRLTLGMTLLLDADDYGYDELPKRAFHQP